MFGPFPCSWMQIRIRNRNTDPDPGKPTQYGSMRIRILITVCMDTIFFSRCGLETLCKSGLFSPERMRMAPPDRRRFRSWTAVIRTTRRRRSRRTTRRMRILCRPPRQREPPPPGGGRTEQTAVLSAASQGTAPSCANTGLFFCFICRPSDSTVSEDRTQDSCDYGIRR
jgi:hypothetical protein